VSLRIGMGYDIHKFKTTNDSVLILAGENFEEFPSLDGHSDADVVCHSLIDAILGALSNGDIGDYFGVDDPKYKGASGLNMLSEVMSYVKKQNAKILNADITVILSKPKLRERKKEMAANISGVIDAPCNLKATDPEQVGELGASAAIACLSTVLLELE
jgi:2-C-methyl-D-erythritol 2,4-cyclodiphosphate synthase